MSEPLTVSSDNYIQAAEMYDILSEQHWQSRQRSLRNALIAARPDAKLVLDVGSGTGMALKFITEALPGAHIHAIEPSASMRVGLMTRVLADAQLRRQVTVHPTDIAQAVLPADIDVALVCGCVGFFDDATRRALWPRLAAALAPAGVVLVDVMPLDATRHLPESRVASVDVGQHRFDIWLSGHPVDDGLELIRWRMRFEQLDGDTAVRSFSIERDWRAFSLDTLLAEAAEAGFQAQPLADSPVPAALLRLG
ncbi:methyltransferase [Pollutimonas bauzanensis]|uniref:Methyltransferase domain-containing protein n=1 Tax=Pollutimonas bauzanensis TaxID=658167 RepID=A0A1M5ZN68_9BURK|nr:class I SAM-dependent methyltransferase [Pollutimonas bauzanensis]SHI25608.1 Methyltransferase domain-containing protein [Pollutimonas bauzanensis]